jgi:hypothetical protein
MWQYYPQFAGEEYVTGKMDIKTKEGGKKPEPVTEYSANVGEWAN